MTAVLKLVDPDKPAPAGTFVVRLTSRRAVWFALAVAAALVVLGLTPSTFIESSEVSPYGSYRIEWRCPTFGESTGRVSAVGSSLPAGKLDENPCAAEAGLRRTIVLVGVPWALAIAALSIVARMRLNRPAASKGTASTDVDGRSERPGMPGPG